MGNCLTPFQGNPPEPGRNWLDGGFATRRTTPRGAIPVYEAIRPLNRRVGGLGYRVRMPLISQQRIVSVVAKAGGEEQAIELLTKKLESYPPVRIVAIATRGIANPLGKGELGTRLTAVVETV